MSRVCGAVGRGLASLSPVFLTSCQPLLAQGLGNVAICEGFVIPCPLANAPCRVTSPFGPRVENGQPKFHPGVDLAANENIALRSVTDGKVVFAGPYSSYGNFVIIKRTYQSEIYVTPITVALKYAHLSSVNVTIGQDVRTNQIIGFAGRTGKARGPHLHFEFALDAYEQIKPSKNPADNDSKLAHGRIDPAPCIMQ